MRHMTAYGRPAVAMWERSYPVYYYMCAIFTNYVSLKTNYIKTRKMIKENQEISCPNGNDRLNNLDREHSWQRSP